VKAKRAAIYVRVSTNEEETDMQEAFLIEFTEVVFRRPIQR
jgi:DNA invertase Pin-like site-specific DNA recombinase